MAVSAVLDWIWLSFLSLLRQMIEPLPVLPPSAVTDPTLMVRCWIVFELATVISQVFQLRLEARKRLPDRKANFVEEWL